MNPIHSHLTFGRWEVEGESISHTIYFKCGFTVVISLCFTTQPFHMGSLAGESNSFLSIAGLEESLHLVHCIVFSFWFTAVYT